MSQDQNLKAQALYFEVDTTRDEFQFSAVIEVTSLLDFPATISAASYSLKLSGIEIASGEEKHSLVVSKKRSELLTIMVKCTSFSSNPNAEFDLKAHLTVQMPLPLGEVKLHLAQVATMGIPPCGGRLLKLYS